MAARVAFVDKLWGFDLLDYGIGSGAFIERRNQLSRRTYGYDINPAGIAWLKARQLWVDVPLYNEPVRAMSMWDVLEHIDDFPAMLDKISDWLFVSLPIFRDAEHVLRSKHYRKDEHFWYFTRRGLLDVMSELGFELIIESDMETKAGREDIGAFAFRRR
jgi:hypothetical protein